MAADRMQRILAWAAIVSGAAWLFFGPVWVGLLGLVTGTLQLVIAHLRRRPLLIKRSSKPPIKIARLRWRDDG